MGSSFVLSVLIDQEGVMRRSDAAFSEITCSGTSAMFFSLLLLCALS
jgi:hypothetical protein